jgi:serine phosphatase RsbU (regulator of sigma subunit)/CHASE1-domain containing sensor protein
VADDRSTLVGPRTPAVRPALIAAAIALLLLLTAALTARSAAVQRDESRRDERELAGQAAAALRSTIAQTLGALGQGEALVDPDGAVDERRFTVFARGLLDQTGILAVGYEQVVPAAGRAAFERLMGRRITDLTPRGLVPSPPRPVYYPIRAIEPPQARTVLAYDPAPEPSRGRALRAARDAGEPRLSSPTPLAATNGGTGLSAFAPLYRPGAPTRTLAERRAATVGFISAIYRAEDIASLVGEQLPEGTALRVLDDGEPVVGGDGALEGSERVEMIIAGRRWTVEVAAPGDVSYRQPVLTAATGTAVTGFVALLFLVGARREREGRRAAQRSALIARVMQSMGVAEGEGERLEGMARELVPAFADAAVVHVGSPGALRRTLARPEEGPLTEPLSAVARDRHHLATAAALPVDALPAEDGEGGGSAVIVPLPARARMLGTLALARTAARGPFTADDVELAEELGRRVGLAVDNARLLERERAAREAAERAERRASHLQALTGALSGALTPEQVADAILTHAEGLQGASGGALALLDRDGARLEITGSRGVADAEHTFALVPLDAPVALAAAVREGRPIWLTDREEWERKYPVGAAAFAASGVSSANLPLNAAGRTLGALELVFPTVRRFTPAERADALAVAQQCAQALERARLYAAEHHLAETLQRSLLPPRLPDVPGLEVAARYEPAVHEIAVGGDWYDAVELPDGRLGVAVGDVVGRGAPAAAVMGQLRSALRAYAGDGAPPAQVIAALSRFAEGVEDARLTTACYAVIDPVGGVVRVASAGHPPALLHQRDGTVTWLTEGRGSPLASGGPPAPEGLVVVPPGATLVLYTDGAVERRGRTLEDGFAHLAGLVSEGAAAGPEELCAHLVRRLLSAVPHDDVAVLAVRVAAVPVSALELEVPAAPVELARVRREVRAWLRRAGATPCSPRAAGRCG